MRCLQGMFFIADIFQHMESMFIFKKKTGPYDLRFSVKILLGYAVVEAMYGIKKSVLCRTNKIKVSIQLLNVDFKYLLI